MLRETTSRRKALLAFASCLVSLLVACGDDAAAGAKKLRFTAIPDRDETLLREKFAPVVAHLSRELGVEVEYVHATRYEDAVELFKTGDVHLAWFGGLTGVQVRHAVAGARAIAQGASDPQFHTYFIAHKDTGLSRSDDFPMGLKGRRFTFGAQLSTSGRLMPEHFIRKFAGISPEEFFGAENSYSINHPATIKLVAAGTVEAGAVNYVEYDKQVEAGTVDSSVCKIIWKTPPYPDYNFTAHPVLEEMFGQGFIDRLQAALISITDPEMLGAFQREALMAASNADFAAIERLARELGFIRG